MKTRTRTGLICLFLLLFLVAYWCLSQSRPAGLFKSVRPQSQDAEPPQLVQAAPPPDPQVPSPSAAPGGVPPEKAALFKAFFAQSISLYGLVLDQSKQPIEGATVRLGVHDNPNGSGSEYFRVSDAYGRFQTSDLRGAAINAEVSKEGYYNGLESRRILKPGEPISKEAPVVFVLYKIGDIEPVVYLRSATVEFKDVGGIAYLDFKRGRLTHVGNGSSQMRIEIASSPGRQRGRAWAYKIIVPGGGLQKRTHEFSFSAPEAGYLETVEGGYGGNAPEDPSWRGSFGDHFFARLADGSVARFQINLGIKGGSYVEISQLVYNPNSSSRNLEYDPAKALSTGR